jgi:hypothetical protein
MTDRGPDGKFVKGSKGGPGRKPLEVSESVTALIDSVMTVEDWEKIIYKLRELSLRGNLAAINALLDRRWGKPVQPTDNKHSGDLFIEVDRVKND